MRSSSPDSSYREMGGVVFGVVRCMVWFVLLVEPVEPGKMEKREMRCPDLETARRRYAPARGMQLRGTRGIARLLAEVGPPLGRGNFARKESNPRSRGGGAKKGSKASSSSSSGENSRIRPPTVRAGSPVQPSFSHTRHSPPVPCPLPQATHRPNRSPGTPGNKAWRLVKVRAPQRYPATTTTLPGY